MDNFNDFMFSYTSRIPVDDILEQTREIKILEKQNDENKIVSPYTRKRKKSNLKYIIIYTISVIVLIVLVVLIVKYITDKQQIELNNNDYYIERNDLVWMYQIE